MLLPLVELMSLSLQVEWERTRLLPVSMCVKDLDLWV